MIRTTIAAVAAVAALMALPGLAQAQGAFDFSRIPGLPAQPNVQVDLNPTMLGFVAEAARAADPIAAEAMAGLRGVRVRVYNLEPGDTPPTLLEFIDDASGELEADDWQRTVFVNEGDNRVRVYMKFDGTDMAGLTLMVLDGSGHTAVFANIDGTIEPAMLGRVAETLGMSDVLGAAGGTGERQ